MFNIPNWSVLVASRGRLRRWRAGVVLTAIFLVLMYELCADVHWHHVWLVTPFIYDLLYFIFSIRVTSVLW